MWSKDRNKLKYGKQQFGVKLDVDSFINLSLLQILALIYLILLRSLQLKTTIVRLPQLWCLHFPGPILQLSHHHTSDTNHILSSSVLLATPQPYREIYQSIPAYRSWLHVNPPINIIDSLSNQIANSHQIVSKISIGTTQTCTDTGIALTIYYQNRRGLNGKVNEFNNLSLLTADFDIVAITALWAWIKDNIKSTELFGNSYFAFSCDRSS